MKKLIVVVSIVSLIGIICLAGYVNFIGMMNHSHEHIDDDHNDLVMTEPFKHKEHTQEHAGLACCPCGVCHITLPKKDGEENDEHNHTHEPLDIPVVIRVISAITMIAVIFAALHI